MDPLFQEIAVPGSGRRSLPAAYRLRNQLVRACHHRLRRIRAGRLLDSIGNAAACSAMLAGFAAEAQLLDERLRRTRNALVHGNPVTIETVASVRALSRYKVDAALEGAIRSIVDDRPLRDLLHERAEVNSADQAQVDGGVPLSEIWAKRQQATSSVRGSGLTSRAG